MENPIENNLIKFWFENDILISKFQKETVLSLDNLKQVIEMREKISGGEKQYWLYDITNLKNLTKEVRDYAERYGQDYLYCIAVLVNSHITKFIFNSYLKLNKPDFPFLFFTKKEKAVEWLMEIKAKNELS
ncbi:DUF7793 family protein [Flavobacterium taihuense]|uniref:DUF7793 domain-containing protein n=1 Tax=Flavobacterium taihuense TaxID=2857508 RepID=A0ABS6XZB0_9FLAO|nr:hypothetical protein [Flavobacterium taihuense]MBW4361621.1 hypothetical protein [Flavobacterium taihuense]